MNTIKTKNTTIIVLCITVICMVVGFIFLTMEWGKVNRDNPVFSVDIISAKQLTPIQGGNISPSINTSITNSNQTVTLNFNLHNPNDEIGCNLTIKNTGTITAEIINLIEKKDYIEDYPINIKYNNIIGKILEPGEEIELNILASFSQVGIPQDINIKYELNLIAKSK